MEDVIYYELRKARSKDLAEIEDIAKLMKSVDRFSDLMKDKLICKYKDGYTGWNDKSDESFIEDLPDKVIEQLEKGSLVNAANFLMFLWNFKTTL